MEILRTPEERFKDLPGYPYDSNYVEINGARVHYIDEGEGEVILCLHGEPSWSYLYRKFIPILASKYRVVCPDFIGFGKSDKYKNVSDYSYKMHFDTLLAFIQKLELADITVVVQDWGGLIGLGVLGHIPDKFARLVIMNTFLPVGNRPMPAPFKIWRAFARYMPGLPVGFVMKSGTCQHISKEILAAYNAPFPDKSYKAGAKAWPLLVPAKPTDGGVKEMKHAREMLKTWDKPALVMFSDKDPIMRGGHRFFMGTIPYLKDKDWIEIKDAGHFLQEDKGEEIAMHIRHFIETTSNRGF